MKRFSILCIVMIMTAAAYADRPISSAKLPQSIKNFIQQNFPDVSIVSAKTEQHKEFDVCLSDGTEIEFEKNGRWEDIKNYNGLPDSLIPSKAAEYIKESYPNIKIIEIEAKRNSWEIKLQNNRELLFSYEGNFLKEKIDD